MGTRGRVIPSGVEAGLRLAKVPPWVRARGFTDEVFAFWARVMRDDEEATAMRIRASENIMERAWGKAPLIVAGDEERPIRVDVSTMDRDRLAALESALMRALGDSIANEPPLIEGMLDYQPDAPSPPAAPTKGQPNANESATEQSSPFVLDNGALQHGDGGDVSGDPPEAGASLRGGEGGAE